MEVEMFDYDLVMLDYNNQKNNININSNSNNNNTNKNKNNLLFEFQQLSPSATTKQKKQESIVIDEDDIIKSPSKKNAKLDRYGFVVTEETSSEDRDDSEQENYREAGKRIAKEQKWIHIVNNWNDFLINQPEKLLYLSSKGIPNNLRSIVWRKMLNISYFKNQYPDDYFVELCKKSHNEHTEQIELDIPRTFPNHKRFFTQRSKKDLLNVLQSYSYHNEKVGYCQGMSYIAGVLLMYLSPEDTFWLLVALLERETMGYYMPGMPQLISDSQLFQKIIEIENKPLGLHLINNGIDPLLYVTPWWMCFFTTLQDWGAVLRLWDLILLEGVNSLFRFSLVILKYSAGYLFKKKGADGLLPYLLRPPIDDIGGIDFLLKTAMELPIIDLVKEAKENIEKEMEEKKLKDQKLKEEKLLKEQQQQQSSLRKSSTLVENNSSNVFDKIIKFIDQVDNEFSESNTNYNNSVKDNSNNIENKAEQQTQQQPQQPQQLKTPVKTGLFSKKIRDLTNRIKSRFIPNYGYQPCNVILEQKLSRKSIARRPSMVPRHSIAQRKSIAPRKSILPPKQTENSNNTTIEDNNINPDKTMETNNSSTTITTTTTTTTTTTDNNNNSNNIDNIPKKPRQSVIRRPSLMPRQQTIAPRLSVATRKSIVGRRPSIAPRKSIKPKTNTSKATQYQECKSDPLTSRNSEDDEWVGSTNEKEFNDFVANEEQQQQITSTNNLLNTSREINKKYPTPSSPVPMIKPPPPSATPLLKILSPTNNSLNTSLNNSSGLIGFKTNNPQRINNCNSSSNSLYSSPLRNQSFYKSPIKTPNHKTINQSVDLLKEIMKTPPNDNKWTTWVSSTNASTIKTCQFGEFSFSSPQQNSPNIYEKQFLKEFSTPTPLKENNYYRNRGNIPDTPQTPSTTTKKRLLFNNNNLNYQNDQENRYIQQTPTKTPIKFLKTNNNDENNINRLKSSTNNFNNNINNNNNNNNNNNMDIDFENTPQTNSPSSYELKQIDHQNFINNKQVKKWDLRV
ncbi:hypothetical protein DICPUDRAFT_157872 [Dictyostelium purpureum]|uniref:Rab-GAP TBC domain-containing protein n=1 Tax=Dictyostelium purpureum TaxID=5786 RepID=F1A078_DICPU|nr:uncharacterized protein DICPUDRAFT_157872 [Dictyostelium purpureum]EGC30401.1 hypothetical protein DICPUDRAFT_157872 [Dictyostelium purpureum]|eukprot:XP_003293069.1 hypothetical protein DICPUDRAFT_157872 [Dictyostelium purpureum]